MLFSYLQLDNCSYYLIEQSRESIYPEPTLLFSALIDAHMAHLPSAIKLNLITYVAIVCFKRLLK